MTNSKLTKRALLTSSISLLLCFAMLLGTTFAWFTDSVTSANNIIKSGNLDVNLYYWDSSMATGTSVAIEDRPDLKLFKNAEGNDILWEPGATGLGQFEVANEGTLALKYQLMLNFSNATKTAEGKTLADVLSVYAIARNRNTGTDAVMGDANLNSMPIDAMVPGFEAQPLKNFVLEGYLLPGESFKYELGVFWEPSDNDNDYNVDGGLSIDFGVTLVATQKDAEFDSYDNQYDKDAKYPVVDAEGLAGALEEGKDVKLEANIALSETIEVTGDIDVDLNGFELDAANVESAFKVEDDATLTINANGAQVELGKNGLVEVPTGADAVIEINGGNFTSDDAASTLIKPNGDGEIKVVLNNVNYTSTAANGYVLDCSYYSGDDIKVEINGGNFEATTGLLLPEGSSVKDATITAKNTKNMQPAVYAMGDMTIENCIIKADKSHAVAVAGGATLTINNCEVYAGSDANALAFQVFSSGGTINVNNTTFTGKYGTTGKMNSGRVAIINIDGVEVYRKG